MAQSRTNSISSSAALALVELCHDACGAFSDGVITAANAAAQQLGFNVGMPVLDLLSDHESERFLHTLANGDAEIRTECKGMRATFIEWRFRYVGDEVLFCCRDVTALLESEDQLEHMMKELRHSAEEMEQFAYVASHDIQEPLRTITNYAAFLQQDFADQLTDDGRQYIEAIVGSAKRCRELVRALLNYSRLGRICSFAWVDVDAEVRSAVEAHEFSIADARATVQCSALPKVWGDAALLGAVFSNLISNAIKFGGPNLQIRIGSREEKDHYVFWVQDTGRGIPERYFDQIFNMFSRLDPSKPGVGVGLASSKKIVALHGGKIWLTSKVGEGSTFYFSVARRHVDENPVGGGSHSGRHGGASRPEDPGQQARSLSAGRRGVRTSILASGGYVFRKGATRSHFARPQSA
jgi:signal transduction histidine kinase